MLLLYQDLLYLNQSLEWNTLYVYFQDALLWKLKQDK